MFYTYSFFQAAKLANKMKKTCTNCNWYAINLNWYFELFRPKYDIVTTRCMRKSAELPPNQQPWCSPALAFWDE